MRATGDRGREQPCDGALVLLGLPAQRAHAVGDRAAMAALGVVVGGLRSWRTPTTKVRSAGPTL